VCYYFALTTLATVGYGDIIPQNNGEKIMGIFLMIVGIAFFSYIMSNFNDVLINYDKKMGIVDQGSDLQVWLTSLSKFTSQKPLPRSLVKKIDQHFRFYWKNDRLSSITKEDTFLKLLPKDIRYDLIMYLFDEVFQMFRGFFLKKEFENSQFFYDVAFYLLPRKAEAGEKILEQGDDVNEIYFILDGEVKLSYESDAGPIARYFGKDYYFGDYYVFFEKPAEFDYTSTTPVNMLVLPKSKMLELAAKYKNIYDKMLSNSIRNSMYTSKAMQSSYASAVEKLPDHAGETKKLSHEQLLEKYNMYVKSKAKIKREERIKAKNQEIYNSDSVKNDTALVKPQPSDKNKKNFKQNLEDLEIIAKKIDRLKSKLEQSLS
jgi:CRP-like cAMP-binding protein